MKKINIKNIVSISTVVLFAFVLISTQLIVNILAKYQSNKDLGEKSQVASFLVNVDVVDVTNTITINESIDYEFTPGSKLNLDINLNGTKNEVKVKYTIIIETLNNLPIEISYNDTDVLENNITGEINPQNSTSIEDIIIEWPSINNSYSYSGQIDLITVTIVIEQID